MKRVLGFLFISITLCSCEDVIGVSDDDGHSKLTRKMKGGKKPQFSVKKADDKTKSVSSSSPSTSSSSGDEAGLAGAPQHGERIPYPHSSSS